MSTSYKKDFPLFTTHSGIIYLDSAASTQKPHYVIDGISDFMKNTYANIHRGNYSISEEAEELYYASKQKYASYIGFKENEIIYTYNATYAYNMLAQTLWYSGVLQAGDIVLVDIAEHHANIVPRQMLSQRHGIIVERIDLTADFQYDIDDFKKKYTDRVKVVSLSAASNVTGVIYDLTQIIHLLRPDTFCIIDGSQLIPHCHIKHCFFRQNESGQNGGEARIDALIATGHKIMADTGIGMLALRNKYIKSLTPARGGGGMIDEVQRSGFQTTSGWQKFEPGTPHIIGAVSLLKALEYIDSIGGYDTIIAHENQLIDYALMRFSKNKKLTLFGQRQQRQRPVSLHKHNAECQHKRLGIFSFGAEGIANHTQLGEKLAAEGICVRTGAHCTHPLFHTLQRQGSCRISTYIYNDITDLEKTFNYLESL